MAYLSTIDFFEDKSFLDRWQRTLVGAASLSRKTGGGPSASG